MSLIQKAARALWAERGGDWASITDRQAAACRGEVRAVLLAIRDPDADMIGNAVSEYVGDIDAERTWQAMIDEARKEAQ